MQLQYLENINDEYIEPIGYAVLVETLLSFILFLWLFAKIEKHEQDKAIEVKICLLACCSLKLHELSPYIVATN